MSFDGTTLFNLLPAVYRLKDTAIAGSGSTPLLSPIESARTQSIQSLSRPLTSEEQAELQELLDKSTRGPLQSLMMLIAEQLAAVENDLDQLYDDQFIETCAPWVIPYIGDLIGFRSGYRVTDVATVAANLRAEVAHTISFRRRKGTVLVLEQLAHDATGWGAHAVEFFRVLACTQYMNHLRPDNHYAPNLRRWEPREYRNTGFDTTAHTVDVRRIAVERGRYNIRNIGIFLWSLNAYGLTKSPATASTTSTAAGCFRFNPLGADMPLFNNPVLQSSDETVLTTPLNVPDRLRRWVLCQDIRSQAGAYYGEEKNGEKKSLALYINGGFINASQIQICDLSGEDGHWANVPVASPYRAAIDPHLGRIAVAGAPPAEIEVSFYYGFNGEMGGGEYPRNTTENPFAVNENISLFAGAGSPPATTLQDAINQVLSTLPENGKAAIEFPNTLTYVDPGTSALMIHLPKGATLEIRAADDGVIRTRTTLLLDAEIIVTGDANSTLALNGLVIGLKPNATDNPLGFGLVQVPASAPDGSANLLGTLTLTHCTLVPGGTIGTQDEPSPDTRPALVVQAPGLQVTVSKSILGAVRADEFVTFGASDSIIDAARRENLAYAAPDESSGGGALTLTGCTIIGRVHATLFALISNCIIWAELSQTGSPSGPLTAALLADRKQEGCVRFSYLPVQPEGMTLPHQFQCVVEGQGFDGPIFYSLRYSQPGYCKLFPSTPDTVRRGADDGGEMGAFHFLNAPMRETDLLTRMREYLPAGLEFGIFYET
jgi:hypothetical protein